LHKESVELSELAERAYAACEPLARQRGHTLKLTRAIEPVYLDVDPVRMQQVLVNLLSNAAKYTDPPGEIRLTVARSGNEAVLRVEDNGVGLPPERIAQIFELFMQVDSSLNRSQGGLGIGLALVRRLVELHGGSVSAESEGLGRGSRFTVRLPISLQPNAPKPAAELQTADVANQKAYRLPELQPPRRVARQPR
jgi:signal transduction histidine kinase